MANTFSLSEVFEMAEEIERNGYHFYKKGADTVKDKAVKEILLDLAAKERVHESIFHEMRMECCQEENDSMVDPEGEVSTYVRLMADTHVFNLDNDVFELLTSVQSPRSMLKLALGFEKETIVFFNALKESVSGEYRDKVERLVREEYGHVRLINESLKSLQASS